MAGQIPLDNNGHLSDRLYTEFQVTALQKADLPGWGPVTNTIDQQVTLSLFRDEITGIMVNDVERFEAYINTVATSGRIST